jgi:hypothetical protein
VVSSLAFSANIQYSSVNCPFKTTEFQHFQQKHLLVTLPASGLQEAIIRDNGEYKTDLFMIEIYRESP